ncbi:7466_t:CDS:2 [Ambispora gerdemannii]|uniref:7466_t:CDS:1 n=1 Tax=Ambispora gerdemannii TaxID=144530 RepID=A0A9N8ZJM6_9GLOM|nr:7466_t:CDS:2 [Ambispora gerdemannii]
MITRNLYQKSCILRNSFPAKAVITKESRASYFFSATSKPVSFCRSTTTGRGAHCSRLRLNVISLNFNGSYRCSLRDDYNNQSFKANILLKKRHLFSSWTKSILLISSTAAVFPITLFSIIQLLSSARLESFSFFQNNIPFEEHFVSLDNSVNEQDSNVSLTHSSTTINNNKVNFIKICVNNVAFILSNYILEPFLTTCRFAYLVLLFLPLIVSAPALLIGRRVPESDNERTGTLLWYDFLVKQMETAGPTFIKLAQWAASRTDIFPEEMCNRLSKLHSAVDPHPFTKTKLIIEGNFGLPFEMIFEEFDPKPIGIGALAQLIRRDLKILMVFAKIINEIPTMQWLSLPEEVAKFGEMMQDHLDLRIEANNLKIFLINFKDRASVSFPRPFVEYTTKNMLIEEYEPGIPIKRFLELGGGVFEHTIADIGLKSFLHMLIFDNFVHADLHPGNILVTFVKPKKLMDFFRQFWINLVNNKPVEDLDDSKRAVQLLKSHYKNKEHWEEELDHLFQEGFQPVIIYLDTGLVTSLNAENRRNFLDLFRAVAEFDGYRAGKLMIERSKMGHLVVDGDVFALKMQNLVLKVKSMTLALSKIQISEILTTVLHMVRKHHVKLEGDFVNVILSVLLLEGIGRQLDPEIDLLKSALPILRQLGAQEAKRGVKDGKIREIPVEDGSWLMFWIWLEAREWVGNLSWDELHEIMFYKHIWWSDM